MQTLPPPEGNPTRSESRRTLISVISFILAILILILVTANYLRVTKIDYSPEQGVTQLYVSPTPAHISPTATTGDGQPTTSVTATPIGAGSNGLNSPQPPHSTSTPTFVST